MWYLLLELSQSDWRSRDLSPALLAEGLQLFPFRGSHEHTPERENLDGWQCCSRALEWEAGGLALPPSLSPGAIHTHLLGALAASPVQ